MRKSALTLLCSFIAVLTQATDVWAQSTNDMSVASGESRYYKNAIFTRPFAPLRGYISLGYQHAFTPTRSVIGEVGIIGPGIGNFMDHDAKGAFVKLGLRLRRAPEIVTHGMEWGHNVGGFYFQPEIAYSSFQRTFISTEDAQQLTGRFKSGAFMIGAGRQMVIGDIFTFDLGASLGYAFTQKPKGAGFENFDIPRQYYSHSAGGDNFPVAWKLNLTMGILIR